MDVLPEWIFFQEKIRPPHFLTFPVFVSDMGIGREFFLGHQRFSVEAQRHGAQILHARDACPESARLVMASQRNQPPGPL